MTQATGRAELVHVAFRLPVSLVRRADALARRLETAGIVSAVAPRPTRSAAVRLALSLGFDAADAALREAGAPRPCAED